MPESPSGRKKWWICNQNSTLTGFITHKTCCQPSLSWRQSMVAGVLVSMASSNRIVCRGCFLGHSAALLPQNLYVSPPKLPCIAAKNHLKFRRLGSFPPKFSRYWYVSQQSCIQQNVQGCAAAKFCGSNAALPLCDQKKKFVANRRISAVSHHGPYMCCDGAI